VTALAVPRVRGLRLPRREPPLVPVVEEPPT
jgi:hypothetical protein